MVSHISTNGSFGGYSFVMVVRTDLFDSLAPDVQAAMLDLGQESARHVAQAQDDAVAGLVDEWKAEGIDLYSFSPEELSAVTDALGPVTEDWVQRLGSDQAMLVLETYRKLTSN